MAVSRTINMKPITEVKYTKINDNTYERYNPKTKMKVILCFSNGEHDEEIDEFFTKTLSKLYLDRISKVNK